MARAAVKANYSSKDIVTPSAEPAVVTGQPRVHRAPAVDVIASDKRQVRLAQKGWENFTGDFGQVIFQNGVSVSKVTNFEYDRIATQIRVVDNETGEALGPGQRQQQAHTVHAPLKKASITPEGEVKQGEPEIDNRQVLLGREALYKIVDTSGIDGLRKIAAPLGVKARSIPELINAIDRAQKSLAAKRAGEAAPESDGKDDDVIVTEPGQDFSFDEGATKSDE